MLRSTVKIIFIFCRFIAFVLLINSNNVAFGGQIYTIAEGFQEWQRLNKIEKQISQDFSNAIASLKKGIVPKKINNSKYFDDCLKCEFIGKQENFEYMFLKLKEYPKFGHLPGELLDDYSNSFFLHYFNNDDDRYLNDPLGKLKDQIEDIKWSSSEIITEILNSGKEFDSYSEFYLLAQNAYQKLKTKSDDQEKENLKYSKLSKFEQIKIDIQNEARELGISEYDAGYYRTLIYYANWDNKVKVQPNNPYGQKFMDELDIHITLYPEILTDKLTPNIFDSLEFLGEMDARDLLNARKKKFLSDFTNSILSGLAFEKQINGTPKKDSMLAPFFDGRVVKKEDGSDTIFLKLFEISSNGEFYPNRIIFSFTESKTSQPYNGMKINGYTLLWNKKNKLLLDCTSHQNLSLIGSGEFMEGLEACKKNNLLNKSKTTWIQPEILSESFFSGVEAISRITSLYDLRSIMNAEALPLAKEDLKIAFADLYKAIQQNKGYSYLNSYKVLSEKNEYYSSQLFEDSEMSEIRAIPPYPDCPICYIDSTFDKETYLKGDDASSTLYDKIEKYFNNR